MKAQSRKFRITARFFTGAKRYFIMAVFASLITTILNSLTPQIFRFTHARVMSDTLKIAGVAAWGLVDMFWAFLYVVSVFVVMFVLNARLAAILLVIVPCIAVITVVFQNKILHWNRRVRRINSQITSAYNEGITGVKTSKTMGIESDNEEAFFERTSDMYRSAGKAAKLNAVYIPTILLFGSAAAAFVLYRGGYMVQQDLIKLGTLSVFISYAVVIFEPIQQLARLLADLISCQANIERVMDLLEQTPDVTDRPDIIENTEIIFIPRRKIGRRFKEILSLRMSLLCILMVRNMS